MLKLASLVLLVVVAAPQPAAAQKQDTARTREWTVPWEGTRPRDPIVDRQNRVWFVGQRGNYVGLLNPGTGEFRKIDLPPKALPHNIIVGPDNFLWYAGNGDSHIGRMNPETGEIRKYPMPADANIRDPHTLQFSGNELWFTAQGANVIGRLTPETGDVKLLKPSVDRARPYGIVLAKDGTPWVALFGTNRVAMVDRKGMKLKEHTLPWDDARPRRIQVTSDGIVWYADYARGTLGRFDPKSGKGKEFALPGGKESRPYAMALDDKDRVWVVATGRKPNRLVGFDSKTNKIISDTAVPSGGGTVRHMVFHKQTESIWFGTDNNTIGQAEVGPRRSTVSLRD
jgi:virginiamycin B lyase